ncbi:hypothetical protein EES39_14945 [Streptomyces sp. ADI92-24]|uniref:hypothetical protein n=1 Tax=Streptomyces sp. ADI92-24 TaxID=1522756 RepID=UPI000F54CF75|nr:hypothetical protein [Streptomyces sp. ADI92-24]RPK45610.1 hypothetical protein EES39_14945 [Streptomyces sp. ADI92-24]
MLPGGIEAHTVTVVSVSGDEDTRGPSPVAADQLLAVAGKPRFLNLVKYAAAHPMETKEYADRVG